MTQLEKAAGTQRSFDDGASATSAAATVTSRSFSGGDRSEASYHVLAAFAPSTDDIDSAGALPTPPAATFAATDTVTNSRSRMDGTPELGVRADGPREEQGRNDDNGSAAPNEGNLIPDGGTRGRGGQVAVAEETRGPTTPGGRMGAGEFPETPRGLGAMSGTSMARRSSGDLMAMAAAQAAAAEGQEGGDSRGLAGRGGGSGGEWYCCMGVSMARVSVME